MQSKVSVKGQTVIPSEIRKALGIQEGTRLHWKLENGTVRVFPLPKDPVRALVGVLRGKDTFQDWLDDRNAERARERELEAREG